MGAARSGHTATRLRDGRVLIAGGYDGYSELATTELYDTNTGRFGVSGSMLHIRTYASGTLLNDGRVLIAGGYVGDSNPTLSAAELGQ
jgi:hypothetical protein